MSIDFNKPVQTRDGRPVRILCTDAINVNRPIVGLVRQSEENEVLSSWSSNGFWSYIDNPTNNDLVQTPEPPKVITRYANVYSDHTVGFYHSADTAEKVAGAARIARVRVTFEYRPGQMDD